VITDREADTVPTEDGQPDAGSDIGRSAAYLLVRVAILEGRVRAVVGRRRAVDPSPDDPFRGLYVTDEQVDEMLAHGTASRVIAWDDASAVRELEEEAADMESTGVDIRLRSLARRAGLDDLDLDLLLVTLAPDLDPRFERLYGYLNDDVSRRRASVGLALEMSGSSTWSADARSRLGPTGPLVASSLVQVEDPERPFLSRSLRVPDRVTAHLLGNDAPDPSIHHLLRQPGPWPPGHSVESLAAVLAEGIDFAYLRERAGASAASLAASALRGAGLAAVVVDLRNLEASDDLPTVVRVARREALLLGGGLVVGPIDALTERAPGASPLAFTTGRPDKDVPAILYGRAGWEPSWSPIVPLLADAAGHTIGERAVLWRDNLGEDGPEGLDASDVADQFVLSTDGVERAVVSARLQARLDSGPIGFPHLRFGARAQNGAALERLARRIQPDVGWDDLVLLPATSSALEELAGRARHRHRVLDEWGMRPGGGRGRGITVLFAGDSGTGKTMSAEVVAGDLGLDLYTVNLATVVDKYVGETEKNLERIFVEADGVNAVLLFDEADSLFGKRSEVREANDRYANIEVAYLLQRMETFDGIAILATNLSANIDDAFARRLDMVIDFPAPDRALRRILWEKSLGPAVPRADDLDLDFCASAFELSGGNIRSIAISAAYNAAGSGQPVTMGDLVRAVGQEYRKLGRLVVADEFGRYLEHTGDR
jgi:Winged helix domain, variant/ATPase family associated with various cellular activities (AAA)